MLESEVDKGVIGAHGQLDGTQNQHSKQEDVVDNALGQRLLGNDHRIFCGSFRNITAFNRKNICSDCVEKLRVL